MDIHKPKPWHGWQGFLKEYAIIVVGVLTALVGEELVVGVHHHLQVADLRGALHRELAWNLASIKEAADDLPCVEARLKEVEAWKGSLQRPAAQQLKINIQEPTYVIFRTSTWRSAAAGTLDNVPLEERVGYAQFYDGVDNNKIVRETGLRAWSDLSDFKDAPVLSTEDARQIAHQIRVVRSAYRTLARNYNTWRDVYAPATGVKIEEAPPHGAGNPTRDAICKSSIQN